MSTTYPALTLLARAYLHPDYDLEYADAESAVADFMTGEVEQARLLPAEVERALREHPDETTAGTFWLDTLDASYDCAADSIAYRGWLRWIGDRARQAGY